MKLKMKEPKCNECSKKRETHRTKDAKKDLIKRLNIIEGQIRGIKQMIENDRYCNDVLIQICAVNKAIESLGNNILENHLKTCVTKDIQNGKLDIIEEVMQLIKKLQ